MSPPTHQSVRPAEEVETVCLSPADERANILTHGLGFLLSMAAGGYLFWETRQAEWGFQLSCLLFCGTLGLVYLFSTLSHAVYEPHRRNRLRAWDQGTIYLLIVGTYTPFIWQGSEGLLRSSLLAGCWLAAGLGFYSKVCLTHRVNAVATATYLALGWLPAIPLVRSTPTICVQWMILGGLCYSLGVVFLKLSQRVPFSHAAWHIMVMLGSACHVFAVHLLIGFDSNS